MSKRGCRRHTHLFTHIKYPCSPVEIFASWKCFRLPSMVATNYMWLLSTLDIASMAEEMNCWFYLNNLNLNSHTWLMATKLDRGALDDQNKANLFYFHYSPCNTIVQYNIIIRKSVKHFFQSANHCKFSLWNDHKLQNEMSITRKWECSHQVGTQE